MATKQVEWIEYLKEITQELLGKKYGLVLVSSKPLRKSPCSTTIAAEQEFKGTRNVKIYYGLTDGGCDVCSVVEVNGKIIGGEMRPSKIAGILEPYFQGK